MTEQQAREMRLDKVEFKTLDDAIDFGIKSKIDGRKIYEYPDGYFKICRFSKKGEAVIKGFFDNGNYIPKKDMNPIDIINKTKIHIKTKVLDGAKLSKYLISNGISKQDLCKEIHRSRVYMNDVIRKNSCDKLVWEKICDILKVNEDYFDFKEPEPEPIKEKPKVLIEETDHDLLVSLLLSQKKIEALLMEIVSMLK